MISSFRQSMLWVHTWFGLALGFVLMVCFFFGSLSVFDREIDRWAIPQTRFEPQPMPSFDSVLLPVLRQVTPDPADYDAKMPRLHDPSKGQATPRLELPPDRYWAYTTHRDPVLAMGVRFLVPHPKDPNAGNRVRGDTTIDPRTGTVLPVDQLKIGSAFFYPLHYSLHLSWYRIGYWIVGLAALAMLAALVTGLFLHRRVLRELFTFRPWKDVRRRTLDLHNLTGVVALPFHFFFAFTGLAIFAATVYFPVTHTLLRPMHDRQHELEARYTGLPAARSGIAAPLGSVDAMVAEAKRRWAARAMPGEVGFLRVHHVGDANSYVSIYRAGSDRVALVGEGIHFRASTGEVLREDPEHGLVSSINEFLKGLHLQHFEHWLLRWLYVLGGLLGCVCIATGFLFFVEKRKRQHAQAGGQGCRIVDALAVTTVTGMLIATGAILVANRLLPADLSGKGTWEQAVFWGAWLLAMMHAFGRSTVVLRAEKNPAWREQCLAFAGLAITAVALNWITTGDHFVRTLHLEPYWPVAGVDLSLLVAALIAIVVARRLAARAGAPAAGGGHDAAATADDEGAMLPSAAKAGHG